MPAARPNPDNASLARPAKSRPRKPGRLFKKSSGANARNAPSGPPPLTATLAEKYQIECSYRNVVRFFHEKGFSLKVPPPSRRTFQPPRTILPHPSSLNPNTPLRKMVPERGNVPE